MGKKKTMSDEEKTKLVKLIDSKRAEGLSVKDACKAANWNPSNYNWWKAALAGQSRKPATARLARELATAVGKNHFQVQIPSHKSDNGRFDSNGSGLKSSGNNIKVTVKEYTFEGTDEQVMQALGRFKDRD